MIRIGNVAGLLYTVRLPVVKVVLVGYPSTQTFDLGLHSLVHKEKLHAKQILKLKA